MVGEKYNFLTIVDEWKNDRKQIICRCKCDCGNESIVPLYKLKAERIKSCGCMRKKLISEGQKKHGGRGTLLYSKWCGIKRRCYNENDSHYKDYGERGIKMCKEWKENFSAFQQWAYDNGYVDGLSLERADVNADYTPENCLWIELEDQVKNKRNTIHIIYNGESKRVPEIAELEGCSSKTIRTRYYRFKKRHPEVNDDEITYDMILPIEKFKGTSYHDM